MLKKSIFAFLAKHIFTTVNTVASLQKKESKETKHMHILLKPQAIVKDF